MPDMDMNQVIRLLQRLIPKALRWWKKRKQQQQQQQQGGGNAGPGGSYNNQQSYNVQPGQQQPGGQQYFSGGSWGSGGDGYGSANTAPHGGVYAPHHSASHPKPHQYSGVTFGGDFEEAHKPSLTYDNTSHFGQHVGHVNQDMINASNSNYVKLRNDAIHEGDLMHQAFNRASQAHERGDGAAAKQFSDEGHAHQRRRDELNEQASNWIFQTNNQQSPQGTVDLHGLFVSEAIQRTEQAVQQAQMQGLPQLRVITGKGLHSTQHVAKIKPAVEELMIKYRLSAHIDPHNSGVLIVDLQNQGTGSRDIGFADQLASHAEGDKCIIS